MTKIVNLELHVIVSFCVCIKAENSPFCTCNYSVCTEAMATAVNETVFPAISRYLLQISQNY